MQLPERFQPGIFENDVVIMKPLKPENFEDLYAVARDPEIWQHHPVNNRYERDEFKVFFDSAFDDGMAFLVYDQLTKELIGSSRYYGYEPEKSRVAIGYTFLVKSRWGGLYNFAMKQLLIDHAFHFVDSIVFHIGSTNVVSQKAILKYGVARVGKHELELHGTKIIHLEYELTKEIWTRTRKELNSKFEVC